VLHRIAYFPIAKIIECISEVVFIFICHSI
jgi:hypothetical protein